MCQAQAEPVPSLTFVDTPAGLRATAERLAGAQELAVDLEQHDYHSFQVHLPCPPPSHTHTYTHTHTHTPSASSRAFSGAPLCSGVLPKKCCITGCDLTIWPKASCGGIGLLKESFLSRICKYLGCPDPLRPQEQSRASRVRRVCATLEMILLYPAAPCGMAGASVRQARRAAILPCAAVLRRAQLLNWRPNFAPV